jgi:arylsulfatase A-like enzyme
MMETMDDTVGLLLAKLDELKLAKNTIVIFTSDNGGLHVLEFPDSPSTHNTPFRAGKGFLYEGGLRVPLIVRWPGVVPAGTASDAPVMQQDFVPTLLEACGVKAAGPFDGVSVLTLWKREAIAKRTMYWHFPHYTNQGGRPGGAIRDGDWKVVENFEDGTAELYNLANDPGEEKDVASSEPARVAAMRKSLAAWRAEMKAQENTPNPAVDAAMHKRLYVDVDASKLKAGRSAAEVRERWQEWRDAMNAAVKKR